MDTRSKATRQTVLWSRAWTPALVTIGVTRDPAFRFAPGRYARVGIDRLGIDDRAADDPAGTLIFRPLSIASAPADPFLEFFCSLIPGGELSARIARLRAGDPVEIETASFGFLTVDTLAPGRDLWLLATGTGLAPFLSMVRDPGVWNAFERIVVVHSVRQACELAYGELLGRLAAQPLTSARATLRYLPVVTREPDGFALSQRIPSLLRAGRLEDAAGVDVDPAWSRVMACGNPEFTREMRTVLGERGLRSTRRGAPGQAAFEKYW